MKKITTIAVVMLISTAAFARPANPNPIEVKQPDGSKITIILKGDERLKWAETEDGYSLLRGKDGFWEYATTVENGDMIASGIKVGKATEAKATTNIEATQVFSETKKHLIFSESQKQAIFENEDCPKATAGINLPAAYSKNADGVINYKMPIILIAFKDKAWKYDNKDIDLIFNTHGLEKEEYTGSVVDYFHDNSRGKFQFRSDIYGPYTLSQTMSYYGNNTQGFDLNAEDMVREAIALASEEGCDFSDYDLDNDGYVDGIHIIFAGYGEEESGESDAIWSHQTNLSKGGVSYNDKKIQVYSCSPELSGQDSALMSIGTAAHELGHVIGLHDYYDTDYAGSGGKSVTPGEYEIMDLGSYNNNGHTPPQHNAYSKLLLGWSRGHILDSAASTVEIFPTMEENTTYIIKTQTEGEFFVLDNRPVSKWDNWDLVDPKLGAGLLVFAVDTNYSGWKSKRNSINCNPSNRGLYIKQADGGIGSTNTIGLGTPFPGNTNNTNFTDASSPSSLSHNGKESGMPITDITINTADKRVIFNLLGGGDTISSGGEEVPPYLSSEEVYRQPKSNVVIYPNPVNNKITVASSDGVKVQKLTLYNFAGKQVAVKQITGKQVAKSNKNELNVSGLPAGIYILEVKTDVAKTSHKIIKK